MTILWFWAAVVAAVFALAAYNQADDPKSPVWLGAVLLMCLAYGYLAYAMPSDLSINDAAFDRHPDELKFRAAGYVLVAATFCFLGGGVGASFRERTSALRIGKYAFVAAFFGLQIIVFFMAAYS